MSWVSKIYNSKSLAKNNIKRYQKLQNKILRIEKLLFATQSGSLKLIHDLTEDQLVKANKDILSRVRFLLSGENNQLVPMDSPHRTKKMLDEILVIIDHYIYKEKIKARGKQKNEFEI